MERIGVLVTLLLVAGSAIAVPVPYDMTLYPTKDSGMYPTQSTVPGNSNRGWGGRMDLGNGSTQDGWCNTTWRTFWLPASRSSRP